MYGLLHKKQQFRKCEHKLTSYNLLLQQPSPNFIPTIIMTSTSFITFIFNTSIILSYLCCHGHKRIQSANKANNIAGYWGMISTLIGLILWGVTSGLFKSLDSENALFGYACSARADFVQKFYTNVVNLGFLCQTQVCYCNSIPYALSPFPSSIYSMLCLIVY